MADRRQPESRVRGEEKAALHISTLNSSVPAGDEVEKLEGDKDDADEEGHCL